MSFPGLVHTGTRGAGWDERTFTRDQHPGTPPGVGSDSDVVEVGVGVQGLGLRALFDAIEGAQEVGVGWLTVFAFSTENWKRPPDEVKFLMNFNESLLVRRSQELHEMGVRIRFVGRKNWRVPKRVLRRMDEAVDLTQHNTGMTLTIAFNYGGRAEIIDAVKAMVDDGVQIDRIDERALERYLYDPTMPDVDLLIRSSGEHRLSNFLLWQVAYSELLFTETLWPDFRRNDLYDAILEYQARDRRFGGLNS